MGVYLLRHEARIRDTSFTTPLSPEGRRKAQDTLPSQLAQINPQTIYCSPFLRTLETIAPYCRASKTTVCLEWALVESYPQSVHEIRAVQQEYRDILDTNYISYGMARVDTEQFTYDELQNNVRDFLRTLPTQGNTVLVTHMPVINAILTVTGRPHEMMHHHLAGSLTLV